MICLAGLTRLASVTAGRLVGRLARTWVYSVVLSHLFHLKRSEWGLSMQFLSSAHASISIQTQQQSC